VVHGFYLKITRAKGHTYAQLARSYRDGPTVRSQILQSFGRVTDEQVSALRAWMDTNPLTFRAGVGPFTALPELRVLRSWQYGRVALGHFLWRDLGVHHALLEALAGVPSKARVARLIELMVLNRIDDPTSKLGLLDWMRGSAAPFLVGLPATDGHENLFYRAMDRLWLRRNALERRLYERVVRPTTKPPTILYHDLTSSYYEGQGGPLARFGYSRDHRSDRPQITWGMVVTPEGLPITMQVYPGNTTDNTTVVAMRERLTETFGIREGIYVGDRGMKTMEVLEDLHRHGFHYVLAEVNRNVEEILREAPKHRAVPVGESNVAREVIGEDGRRFVVLLNRERRRQELETLERRVAQGRAILEHLRRAFARGPERHHHTILRQAHAALDAKGLGDLFDLDWDENTFQGLLAKVKERVARRRREAGWWVLTTDTDLPIAQVARLYLGLTIIEQGWREIKSVLEVRPLHHRLDRRVEAHLLVCLLAYLLQQMLELRLKRAEVPMTGPGAVEAFQSLVLNEVEIGETGVRRQIVTELGKEHQMILKGAGLERVPFQKGWERLD
jgi:transposase